MDMRYSALLIGLFLTAVAAPAADSPIRNYEECVKAGHSTGKTAGQDVCLSPKDYRTFVKGLKPTIPEGIYGTVMLRTGNCQLRIPTQIDTHSAGKTTLVPIEIGICSDANRHPCLG